MRDAKREFETRQKWAQEQYDATVKKAKADYVVRLKAALDAALKAKDLDGANAIDAEIKAGGPTVPTDDTKDQRLKELLTGQVWKLEYWHHGQQKRATQQWAFKPNGTLTNEGHPNWRIHDGVLEVYQLFQAFRWNATDKRWESEMNSTFKRGQECYILPR